MEGPDSTSFEPARLNSSTLIGMIASVLFMAVILLFGADDPSKFVDLPSIAIVLGGTLAATFLSYPMREIRRIFPMVAQVFRQERLETQHSIEEVVALSRLWMRGDLQAVERTLPQVSNPFLRTGVQLIIDRTPEDEIIDLLQWRIAHLRSREMAEASIFRGMASYAPAFGMVGTLLGLINLMDLVGAGDLSIIGSQLAVALMTTLYGVLLANLLFKPIAVKLERRTDQRLVVMNMVLEGISMMCAGRSPSLMRETLKAFVAQFDDEMYDGGAAPAKAPAKGAAGHAKR
jgi:chemotaxis protein MotA